MDDGDVSFVFLPDLSTAFDIDDHNILLQRHEYIYGISGTFSTGSDPTFITELRQF